MTELATYEHGGLPDNLNDLARFVLFAQEKAKVLQAEIRAIKKLELADAVYQEKLEEQARLRELIVVAGKKVGELTSALPVRPGARTDIQPRPASGTRLLDKPKSEIIQELGFSKSQVQRFEQMAAHPDIVEQVINESREGVTDATQGEVLRRIKEQEGVIDLSEVRAAKEQEAYRKIDHDAAELKAFRAAVDFTGLYIVTPEMLDSVADADTRPEETIEELDRAIQMLSSIKNELLRRGYGRGKKNLHPRD